MFQKAVSNPDGGPWHCKSGSEMWELPAADANLYPSTGSMLRNQGQDLPSVYVEQRV